MKRSDMLERLTALLCPIYGPTEEQYQKYYQDAESILFMLEEWGMQPPPITILKDSYDRTTGNFGFEVNEWEPESN